MRQRLLVYVLAGTALWSLVSLLLFLNRPASSARKTEQVSCRRYSVLEGRLSESAWRYALASVIRASET